MTRSLQPRSTRWATALAATLTIAATSPATAQDYPTGRPVSIVLGYGPGTGIDVIAREVAARIGETMKTTIVVENKVGANGALATDYVAQAKPDGYTILIISSSGIINEMATQTRSKVGRDFDPVAFAGTQPYAFAVPADFPAKSMSEFVALARSRPGQINWTSLPGGLPQYMGEMFNAATGAKLVPVPYKSTTEGLTDVISGRVPLWITTAASAINAAKGNRLRLLAVTSEKRLAAAADIPTMKEANLDALSLDVIFVFLAPRGTPAPILARLNREISAAVSEPKTIERLASQGVEPKTASQAEVARIVQAELARWEKVVAASKK